MVCANVIDREMDIWVAMGGGNSGCCGNAAHSYGYHMRGNQIGSNDYSRRYDPGTPRDFNECCAGDFSHRNNPVLRAKHAELLARLMRGELPTVEEFIGKPWANQPVYYWFRYNGVGRLQKYTGVGHDHWSHIGVRRSRTDVALGLWTPTTQVVLPVTPKPVGWIDEDGELGRNTIRRWQQYMGTVVDGVISRDSSLVRAIQVYLNKRLNAGLAIDGDGIWQNGKFSWTHMALQQYLNTPMDGKLSSPRSMAVQRLQYRLNRNTF